MSNVLEVSLFILIVLGACSVMSGTTTNTTLQILTPEEMRGRVLSIWIMVAFGLAPFGNLLIGWVAKLSAHNLRSRLVGASVLLSHCL